MLQFSYDMNNFCRLLVKVETNVNKIIRFAAHVF